MANRSLCTRDSGTQSPSGWAAMHAQVVKYLMATARGQARCNTHGRTPLTNALLNSLNGVIRAARLWHYTMTATYTDDRVPGSARALFTAVVDGGGCCRG